MKKFYLYLPNDTEYEYEPLHMGVIPGQKERTNCRNDDAQPGFPDEPEVELPEDLVLIACWVNNCPMTLEDMQALTEKETERLADWLLEQPEEEYDPT